MASVASPYFVAIALCCFQVQVCSGQGFATVTVVAGEAFEGNQKVLTCRYVINETYVPVPTLTGMLWRKGSDGVGFLPPVGAPTYNPGYNEPEYVISTVDINAGCDLTIQSVAQTDSGMYTCVVYASYSGLDRENPKSANLTVSIIVPPSTITLSYDGMSYNNGTSIIVVAGDNHQFTCSTPGVYPDAIFTWTLPTGSSTDQPQGTQTSSPNAGDISLVDSSNTLSISIPEKPATAQLICGATNRQDGSTDTEIHITVTLEVKVPPKMVSLFDSSGDIGASLTVNQGTLHNLQCLVQGTRPAASIEWFLDSVTLSTGVGNPLETETDGLWDTTGFWSFTPSRSHHKQVVKCEAKTDQSKSFPSDYATIDVIGPPNTPVITPTSPMTEGVATTLTCKADMAFPDDWSLVWSKDGTVTPGQTQPTTDQRYNFTSTLNFIPDRADNGNTITCIAQRDSLSPSPEGSLGPLNVQFCATTLSLAQCPSVMAGDTASMRCVSGSSNPATTLTWFKDSVNVTSPTNRPNVDGEHGGRKTEVTFTTDVLDKSHNGDVYKCCATNTAITSCVADLCEPCTLNVMYPPEFSQPTLSPDTPIVESSEVILTCSADANPLLDSITWEKDGFSDVPGTEVYNDGTSTLTISNTRREHAGYYKCRANNGVPTSDGTSDVHSDTVTLIVHYEPNVTNKAASEVRVEVLENADLQCIVVGNPRPTIKWLGPNGTQISNDMTKYTVYETTGGDSVFENKVTGTLTIRDVDSQVDYGLYTCITFNDIGSDSLIINVKGPRQPDKPTTVRITDRTSSSITVRWTAGHNGGKDQWFHVAHLKAGDLPETLSDRITGNEYTVTDLEDYTDYEIRVYAENAVGRNPDYAQTTTKTLPTPPDSGVTIEFNIDEGTVKVEGLVGKDGCIQIEVQYIGSYEWSQCGECITADMTVMLDQYCPKPQQLREKRAVGDVTDVRTSRCRGDLCSKPVVAKRDFTSPTTTPNSVTIGVVAGVTVGVVLLIGMFVLGFCAGRKFNVLSNDKTTRDISKMKVSQFRRPQRAQTNHTDVTEMSVITEEGLQIATYANVSTVHKAFPRDQLCVIEELGHGAFGRVLLAEATGIVSESEVTLVAVKTLKEKALTADKTDLMQELDLMRKLPDHPNVVKLLGFCIEQDPFYLIVEYLSRGNLKELLKDSRSKGGRVYGNLHGISKSLTSKDLMKFAKDVAEGMAFISSQKCIHRDLAARNVLVADDMTCKVSDFGLARDVMNIRVYDKGEHGKLPLRWMALESLDNDVYTTESDVWSYGVLLWEIVTLGSRPYPGMTAQIMINKLHSGYRMPKPQHCQDELYKIMLRCWEENPDNRPTFQNITDEVQQLIHRGKEYISISDFQETNYEIQLQKVDHEKV